MPDPSLFIAFLAAAFILTVTPGTDTAMILRTAAAEGARPAGFAAIGIALGCLTWGAAVSLGLGALLQASELAYSIVKGAGAAYLIWLGAQLLLRPRHSLGTSDPATRAAGRAALWRGFLANILNPKVGVFYVTFLPQFIPQGADVAAHIFILALIHIGMTMLWYTLLIGATAPLGQLVRRPAIIALLDRLIGGVFIGFGLKLAASRA